MPNLIANLKSSEKSGNQNQSGGLANWSSNNEAFGKNFLKSVSLRDFSSGL